MPEPLVTDFEDALGWALRILGVPGAFIVLFLTVLALGGWVTSLRGAYASARTVGRAAGRGGAWLLRQSAARAFIVVAATGVVLAVQAIMVLRVSYAGGSFLATAFDPARRAAFDAAFPAKVLDPAVLDLFSKVDLVSALYMTLSALVILFSYREGSRPLPVAVLLSVPYCLFLVGTIVVLGVVAAFDALLALLALLVGKSPDWSATKEHVDSYSVITIVLVCGLYCLAAFAAVAGSRALRTLWTIGRDANDQSE